MKINSRRLMAALTLSLLLLSAGVASAQETNALNIESMRRAESDTDSKRFDSLYGQAMRVIRTKPADAEALLLEALKLKSEFIVPTYAQKELATLYLSQKKYRSSIRMYEAVFKSGLRWGGSEEPKILADFADALMGVGEIKRATDALNAAIKSPNGSKSNYAITGFDEERVPTVAEVRSTIHLVRGIHYNWDFQLEQAKSELMSAIRLVPQSGLAHYQLGRYYEEVDKIAEATTEYEKAMRFGSDEVRLLAEKQRNSIAPPKKP